MERQVQVLAPEGQDYLIEITRHFDRVVAAQHTSSGMSFTAGLLLGQFSIFLLFFVGFKYLLLEDVPYGRKVSISGKKG
jgi:maintenance of morphology protein 1